MADEIKLQSAKENSTNELLHKPGIAGVGIGKKIVNGIPTQQDSIMVFVQEKIDDQIISKQNDNAYLIPSEIDGIPTDVFECGEITKMTAGLKERKRPIKPGYSISHSKVSAGTIGGIFYDKDNDVVVLSNFHVLTPDGKAKIGDIIYQPGTIDNNLDLTFKGWIKPLDSLPYIATLKDYIKLSESGSNTHDSAIAKIHPELVKGGFIDIIYPQLGKPLSGFGTIDVNQNIYKLGRTTGFTTGKILSKSATFKIPYDFGVATFTDCIISTPMSQGGDSGSIGINENMQAFGLLFAGSQKVTLYNPISHVANYYGLKIIDHVNQIVTQNTLINTLDWRGYNWKIFTLDGKISLENDNKIHILENANQHAYIETHVSDKKSITCRLNTGTDKGSICGIGIILLFQNGSLKINLRYNDTYGVYYNNNVDNVQNTHNTYGKVEPMKIYTITCSLTNGTWTCSIINDKNQKVDVISIPSIVLGPGPHTVRIGKTGKHNGPQDNVVTNSSEAGETGLSKILFIRMS